MESFDGQVQEVLRSIAARSDVVRGGLARISTAMIRKTVIERLKALLTTRGSAESGGANFAPDDFRLAAAALLVEAARLDEEFEARERETILGLLESRFAMDRAEGEELLRAAEIYADEASDLHGLTRVLKKAFSPNQRLELLEMLWEVAYADGEVHDYEASLIRRVTGLLHVSDRDSGEARKRVLARRRESETRGPTLSEMPRPPWTREGR